MSWPAPSGPRWIRLANGPWNGKWAEVAGRSIIGPVSIFENGFISKPIGEYRYTRNENDGTFYAVWVDADVPR